MGKYSADQLRDMIPDGTLIFVKPIGREIQATRTDTGVDITELIPRWTRTKAINANKHLQMKHTKTSGVQWRQVDKGMVEKDMRVSAPTHDTAEVVKAAVLPISSAQSSDDWEPMEHSDMKEFVSRAMDHKPDRLIISEINWRYAVRNTLRGKNLMIVGPSGCGKTMTCQCIADVFPNRTSFVFNLGASQDPRGMLIGNTHFDKGSGTFFADSLFVQAIQTPGAIILLDELSRAHDDAANILMSVLDDGQRYLRIDERPDTPTIPVADGVVFLSTANVGNEYTGTRVMDRAILDRFIIIEMDAMGQSDEYGLLQSQYPEVSDKFLEAITKIASDTRETIKSEEPKVSTIISTRMAVEMADLLNDGFTLLEVAEVCIYPFYSNAGGMDSERTYMKQMVQGFLPTEFDDKENPWDNDSEAESGENKVPWNQ